jgi:hypothetical protein
MENNTSVQILTKILHVVGFDASLRKVRISGDSLDWVFTRLNRRNCWLTFAALRMDSFFAIHSCETVVRFHSSSARASFRGSDPFRLGRFIATRPASCRVSAQRVGVGLLDVAREAPQAFTDGEVIGSKVFVNEAFALSRARFTSGRKDGARRLRGNGRAAVGVLWNRLDLRDLRVRV